MGHQEDIPHLPRWSRGWLITMGHKKDIPHLLLRRKGWQIAMGHQEHPQPPPPSPPEEEGVVNCPGSLNWCKDDMAMEGGLVVARITLNDTMCTLVSTPHTSMTKNNKWRLSCHVESDSTWPVDGQILNCSWSGAEKRSQTCNHWGGQFSLCKKIAAICCWSVQFWEGFWRWGKKEFPPKQNIIGRDLWAGPANVSWLKVDF